ncbi:STAS domain-containing protein [Saccharothrix longispora]|uniref:Anti-sigma factor antagonist n=1 Tax=Saccharothrix longispora TaxID=33920 RepID=A0ABU1PNW1_9PSEU|nr:STAS domain-containing protein [Saccharothrix longispora]MDR6592355.1 anti-anti-sigma factor [Saccharothrix longispora]
MSPEAFETTTRRDADGATVVLTARGQLDIATVHLLRDPVTAAVGDGDGTVVVDLSDVDFFASVGIDVLLRAHEATRRGGGTLRVVVPRLIRRTLTSVGLAHVLDLRDTLTEALPTTS